MAALTGYLIGDDVNTTSSLHLPDVFSAVFEPAFQTIGTLSNTNTDQGQFIYINSYNKPQRREVGKSYHVVRQLEGANNGNGPAGEDLGRYSDDFYHRIHLTPSQLRLGNLTSSQNRFIEVWNAFFYSVTLEDVQTLNADGLTITPPVGTPYEMLALEPLLYTVSISTDGPPAIDATIRWIVEGVEYDAPITGNRVIPIPMTPDWAEDMIETLEWKTDIIKSYNGEEQRARIRSKPRRGQGYTYTLIGDQASNLENLLWGWQSRLFAVPHWTETTLNQTDLFQGQTGIVTQTESYSYTAGALMFVTDGIKYEMQEIDNVVSGQVNLKKGLDIAWGKPTVIGPVNLARIDGDMSASIKRKTANVATTTLQFLHEPVQTDPYMPDAAATDLYEPSVGVFEEVLLKEPNWVADLGSDFQTEGKVLDFGLQGFALSTRSGIPDIVQQYEWFLKGREQMLEFREFLARRRGKFSGFWMPSWNSDFTIKGTTLSGATGFKAVENYYGLLVAGANGRNHVMVELKNGTKILRKIDSAGVEVDGVTLNIVTNETMGTTFEPEDVKKVCLMGWYRLANDKVTMRYKDRNFASVRMSLVNVLP